MAVNTIYTPVQQPANGVTVAFVFTFKIFLATDLVVKLVDALGNISAAKTLNVDYTVAFDSLFLVEGGTITFNVAPPTGFVSIARSSDLTQGTRFPRDGQLPAKTTEMVVDKLTLQVQELKQGQVAPVTEQQGLFANRPVSGGVLSTTYYATDQDTLYYWSALAKRWFTWG